MAETVTLTEAQIQQGLRDALENLGFSVYSTRFSIRSDPGFPDIVAVRGRDGALVAIECKGPTGKVRPGQAEWIEGFAQVPGCVFAEIVGPVTSERWIGYDVALWQLQNAIEEAPQ